MKIEQKENKNTHTTECLTQTVKSAKFNLKLGSAQSLRLWRRKGKQRKKSIEGRGMLVGIHALKQSVIYLKSGCPFETIPETIAPLKKIVSTVVVCWLLNVPATDYCMSGTDLLRQFYMVPHCDRSCISHCLLPHCDRSCRFNFLPHPVTVY